MTFSIIIPAVNRSTLRRTLNSIDIQQIMKGDEALVIRDDPPHHDWGAWARTEGMRRATGKFLLFMDDDDEYLPGALDAIRKAVQQHPTRVHIFRMQRTTPFNDVIWTSQNIKRPGQVSTQMIAVPNDPERLGTWTPRYEGDFDFLTSTLAKHGQPPVWHKDVIAVQHPNGY